MDEFQVHLELVVVGCAGGYIGPEEGVVVWEGGEDYA